MRSARSVSLLFALLALAIPALASAADCDFAGGFQAIQQQIPDAVGQCVGPEQPVSSVGAFQLTTRGLMVWREADNVTAFSDGLRTWVAGPAGLEVQEVDNEPAPLMKFNTLSGNVHYRRLDLMVPGAGPELALRLAHNSFLGGGDAIGSGWMHTYEARVESADPPGSVALVDAKGNRSFFDRGPANTYRARGLEGIRLSLDPQNNYEADFRNGTTMLFDQLGRLRRETDSAGRTVWVIRDPRGRVVEVRDPARHGSLTFDYDHSTGRLRSVADWLGRSVHYEYDAALRLSQVVDWQGRATTFVYEGDSSRIAEVRGPGGRLLVANGYDAAGRLEMQRDTRRVVPGPPTTITYDARPDGTHVTTSTTRGLDGTWSGVIEDYYDARRQLVRTVTKPSPDPATWQTREYRRDDGRPRSEPADGGLVL
jgi:YD repeat-containing protein